MRRVYIPLRFPTSLRCLCPTRKVRTDSTQAIHRQELPSTRNVSTTSESPRIVFSGIQPTGIPHVRRPFLICRDYAYATLTTASARELLWRACELGQATVFRRARRQTIFLRCRLARPHTAPGPQAAVIFHQDEVTLRFKSHCLLDFLLTLRKGPEPCRTCLDPELYNTRRKVEADDNVEGALVVHFSMMNITWIDCSLGWWFRGMLMMNRKSTTLY
jgi:hypothetical protein